jgi:cytochrome c oxidase assembly protein subunit 15
MAAPALQRQAAAVVADGGHDAASAPREALQRRLARLSAHLLVALIALVAIGGATRVMEAGLACPDWPLCYGSLLPGRQMTLQVFLEWFHRLDAFVVGMGLLVLAGASAWHRRQLPRWQPPLALLCLLLVAAQAGLGALTVLQLLPAAVVTAHLLTALLLVALLSASHQGLRPSFTPAAPGNGLKGRAGLLTLASGVALLLVLGQCLLGGWMASQWAAGRCLSLGDGCSWLLTHRLAARPAALAVLLQAALLVWCRPALRPLALFSALLVGLQIALGVLSLRLSLQMPAVTVAHQISAALLIAVLAALSVQTLRTAPSSPEPIHG